MDSDLSGGYPPFEQLGPELYKIATKLMQSDLVSTICSIILLQLAIIIIKPMRVSEELVR